MLRLEVLRTALQVYISYRLTTHRIRLQLALPGFAIIYGFNTHVEYPDLFK